MSLSNKIVKSIALILLSLIVFVIFSICFKVNYIIVLIALLMASLSYTALFFIFGSCTLLIRNVNLKFCLIESINIPLTAFCSIIIFLTIIIFPPYSNSSQPITDQEPETPDVLYFGYVPDASPISYEQDEHFSGYCYELMNYLKEKNYTFQPAEIKYINRFERKAYKTKINDDGIAEIEEVPKENLIIECAANTITEERKKAIYENGGGYFSKPFAKTGAKLLIRKDLAKNIDSEELNSRQFTLPLENEEIGIVGKTTTSSLIKSIYTASNPKQYTNMSPIISDLNTQKLNIYSSDEILLQNILKSHKSELRNRDEYVIFPEHLLSHENYGIVVYDLYANYKDHEFDSDYRKATENNFDGVHASLLKSINEWIKSESGIKAYEEHIQKLLNEDANNIS